MKLHHFRDLLAVAETGSLRSAARHLGLAQPVITRSIQELERELGVALFDRHAKGVTLTEKGMMFVRRVEAFQADLQRARDEIAQSKEELVGEISVVFSPVICMTVMPRILTAFSKRYPQVVLRISEGLFQTVEAQLENGVIDFWVGPLELSVSHPRFSVEQLFDTSRTVVGRTGHPLREAKNLAELKDCGWVRPALSKRTTETDFTPIFEDAGLPQPKFLVHSGSPLITILAVASTDLLTMLPVHTFRFSSLSKLIQKFDNIEPFYSAPICNVKRHGLQLTPAAEHLCDLIRKAAHNFILEEGSGQSVFDTQSDR
ncbi:LysR substrate-binding domain-containing protein [Sphingobium subterraneum]|uniref:DNA-binding transcriptional LysR family regulator n=1 Tax=Sphingobium subterraneum TaxID=627688 RepID=A0A841J9K7_9SPHN|nr:LysR substrate-binding domain-containing protein [Sphingobium subterraneum]MBB6125238.1 DNA-binding transcriptional LysR family regulator [Sphingobium subterraneum]